MSKIAFGQAVLTDDYYISNSVPKEYSETSSGRLDRIFRKFSSETDNSFEKVNEDYESFVYESNYYLEKLNKSGYVFFDDEIGQYLNKIKDHILQDNPERSNIKVYLTKSPVLNAYTNDFGAIYVNLGALAKVNSVYELYALIAHESSHILNKHTHKSKEFLLENKESDDWELDQEASELKKHSYSRKNEFEADIFGFELLHKANVDLSKCSSLFNTLRYNQNPCFEGEVDLRLLTGSDTSLYSYFQSVYTNLKEYRSYRSDTLIVDDTLSTHPSVLKRQKAIQEFINEHSTPSYADLDHIEFQRIQNIGRWLLVNSYIEEGDFISGLEHVLKLRGRYPDNETLIKAQGKLLTLLTQQSYQLTPFNQFLDPNGSATSDTNFLKFREFILTLNSYEKNILGLFSIKELKRRVDVTYLNRCQQYLTQFLYKYNRELFNYNSELQLKKSIAATELSVNTQKLFYNITEYEKEYYDSIVGKIGLILIKLRSSEDCIAIVQYFLREFVFSNVELGYVADYKSRRELYEQALPYNDFNVTMDPELAIIKYFRGQFNKTTDFDKSEHTTLVQTTNYFLNKKKRKYTLDHKKSLVLESEMYEVFQNYLKANLNLSNSGYSKMSMSDIHDHYCLQIWGAECYQFNDLLYSKVDEQIQRISRDRGLKYLLFNINLGSSKRGFFGKHIIYSYVFYFDIQKNGIVGISKIASKQKPQTQHFKQLFHVSSLKL